MRARACPIPEGLPPEFAATFAGPRVSTKAGHNRFLWNARQDPLFRIPRGTVLWGGFGPPIGPKVVPGPYQVRISSGSWSQTQPFELKGDPRLSTTQADYEAQATLARDIGTRIELLYDTSPSSAA